MNGTMALTARSSAVLLTDAHGARDAYPSLTAT
jgi:hypothetical protein